MASLAAPAVGPAPEPSRFLITASVMLSTIMQVLDSTIANIALPHMQASLGAAPDTISWVLTSYIVASAISLPMTGWLGDKVGRKALLLFSIGGFIVTSMMCGAAQNLTQMVIFRALQGACGAFLVPLGQATMLDAYPKHKHGNAMALWTMGVMVAPIMGPMLGGWLTDNFDWRWVFYVNLPIGILAFVGTWISAPDTERAERRFDLLGFVLIAFAVASLQLMLDRGEQNDWFESTETLIECGLAIACAWMFIIHVATAEHPLFPREVLTDFNFMMALLFTFLVGVALFSSMALIPTMLQQIYGYPIITAGVLMAPRGIGMLLFVKMAGGLVGKVDTRVLIIGGMAMIAYSMWRMSGLSLEANSWPIIESGFIQGIGLAFVSVPLNTVAFATLDARVRTDAASLFNLMRNVGSSLGISMVVVLLARNIQVSHSDIVSRMDPSITAAVGSGAVQALGGEIGGMVLSFIDGEVNRQAAMVSYIDDFYLLFWGTLAAMPIILLMRPPKKRAPGEEEMHLAIE